jgi:putrescine transport system ATP-binding protein
MAPFIRLNALSKNFDEVVAIDNLSLDIEKGELFCLLGASGCGKSTLLRLLAGFERPTSGKIEIDGQDMADVRPADRPVNIMFQNYALFPHMSVTANIGYGLRRAGIRGAELDDRVRDLLALVRMEKLGGRKPHQLSGGQCQRVALARALARRPKLLLLDEPLAALDKKLREDTQFELVDIQEKLGTTFIVVTHDQEEAMTLSTRIGIMDAGQLVQVDAPRNLYERPINQFVADFLGTISFVDGVVVSDEKNSVTIDAPFRIRAMTDQPVARGEPVKLAIRPEKIQLTRAATGNSNEIAVKVEDLAYVGFATNYRVVTSCGQMFKLQQQQRRSAESPLSWGETGYVHFDPQDVIVLRG